jgi:hypothetical protein
MVFSNPIHQQHGTDDRIPEEVPFAMVLSGLAILTQKSLGNNPQAFSGTQEFT